MGDCRPSEDEDTPVPREGETIVFPDLFTAGLRSSWACHSFFVLEGNVLKGELYVFLVMIVC
jgi:hypothetical protein